MLLTAFQGVEREVKKGEVINSFLIWENERNWDLAVEGSNCIRRTGGYKKVIREAHRPINRIGHILEFGMKRGVMLPSTGQRMG